MIKFTRMDGTDIPQEYRGPIQARSSSGEILAETFAPELDGTEVHWSIKSGLAKCPIDMEPAVIYADPTKHEDWNIVVNEFMNGQTRVMLQRMLATAYVAMEAVEDALLMVAV